MDSITIERFWDKVDKNGVCWLFLGSNNGVGYGELRVKGKKLYAHRISYEIHKGAIPDGLVIDHLCSQPNCVNPKHLEAVTFIENVRRGMGAKPKPHIRKDYCINGHNFSENEYIRKDGKGRNCKACIRDNTGRLYNEETYQAYT